MIGREISQDEIQVNTHFSKNIHVVMIIVSHRSSRIL